MTAIIVGFVSSLCIAIAAISLLLHKGVDPGICAGIFLVGIIGMATGMVGPEDAYRQ